MCTGNMFLSSKLWCIIDFMINFTHIIRGLMPQLLFFSLRHLQITHWNKVLQPYRNNIESHSTIYYDCILTRHSQPQSIFHFLLMWEVFLKCMWYKEALHRCSRTGNAGTKQSMYVFELKKYLGNFTLQNMRKLDIMHYLFNKFHSSDVFVIISCEYFQTLRTSEQYPRPIQ